MAKRRYRTWRGRLRRERAGVALIVLLSLAVFEPLLCIVHCQLWVPFALRTYFAQQHQHHHMHGQMAMGAPATPANVVIGQPSDPAADCALHMGSGGGSPLPLPLSPIHELSLVQLVPILIVLLVVIYCCASPTGPPRLFIPPPLRPPIPIAG